MAVALSFVGVALLVVNDDDDRPSPVTVEEFGDSEEAGSDTTGRSRPCKQPDWPDDAPTRPPSAIPATPTENAPSGGQRSARAGPDSEVILVGCGGYILESESYRYTPRNSVITVGASHSNALTVNVTGDENWHIDFAPPAGQALARGVYADVQRFPFNNPVFGGFDLGGEGRGCNEETSTFKIYEIQVENGLVTRLLAAFEQHCESPGAPPAYGIVDFST